MTLQAEHKEFSMELQDERELNEVEGFVDWKGRPAKKDRHGGMRSTLFVYAMVGLENLAFVPMVINLVTYFVGIMHMDIAKAATNVTNFVGTSFVLALLGAFILTPTLTDSKTNILSACLELVGYTILLIQAHYGSLKPPPCNPLDPKSICEKVSGGKAGMTEGCSGAFGADQFDDRDPNERRKIPTYLQHPSQLQWWSGSKQQGVGCWFGISVGIVVLAIISIVSGITTYRNKIAGGSPLTRIVQVFVAAFNNRKLRGSENPDDLYELDDREAGIYKEKLQHTNQF
ncbi:hypothetical protein KI387_017503, partial [Taxus chinensis]